MFKIEFRVNKKVSVCLFIPAFFYSLFSLFCFKKDILRALTMPTKCITVILQIFGVVLFSVFSVVNGFTKIKKTPKA